MKKIALEYNNEKNHWRTRDLSDESIDREGWVTIDECESDVAESFIEKMIEFQRTPIEFRFTRRSFINLLFKEHVVSFAVDRKRREYSAAGKNILILI